MSFVEISLISVNKNQRKFWQKGPGFCRVKHTYPKSSTGVCGWYINLCSPHPHQHLVGKHASCTWTVILASNWDVRLARTSLTHNFDTACFHSRFCTWHIRSAQHITNISKIYWYQPLCSFNTYALPSVMLANWESTGSSRKFVDSRAEVWFGKKINNQAYSRFSPFMRKAEFSFIVAIEEFSSSLSLQYTVWGLCLCLEENKGFSQNLLIVPSEDSKTHGYWKRGF